MIIAPGFAEIFYNNCFKAGLLPVILEEETIERIVENTGKKSNYSLRVDLENNSIADDRDLFAKFEVSDFRKHCLINGFDDIDLSLMKQNEINSYEETRLDFLDSSAC